LQFLQPPHFRSPMEDDLIDQIASRFGRSALIIEKSNVYKKLTRLGWTSNIDPGDFEDEMDDFDEDGEYIGGMGGNENHHGLNFDERFQNYLKNLMGNTDLYCCPLCYIEADRRLGNHGDEEMEADDDSDEEGDDTAVDRFSFIDDPLTILESLDSTFKTASSFCFRLLSGVKSHLKNLHGVNISEISGNDLYKRFQIRASDGLLQRFLRKNLGRNTVQGDMMRYWLGGENQAFVQLLSMLERRERQGEGSGELGSDFSRSFPNRARRVWKEVSSPYLKAEDDLDDFLADGNEDDGDDGVHVPINPHFTPPEANQGDLMSPEEKMIEHLKKKNLERGSKEDSDASSISDDGGKSSDELEILSKNSATDDDDDDGVNESSGLVGGEEEEGEEEGDEWMKSKQYKSNASQNSTQDSDDDIVFNGDKDVNATAGAKKKLFDSSDEE